MRKTKTVPKPPGLTAKENRDLAFLFSLMVDQQDWLVRNLQKIVADSDGDIISSWVRRYITDHSGHLRALPDSVWDGCLADYRDQRDQLIRNWWMETMGCG